MKTPMQELLTAIRLTKYSEINEQAWEAYDYVIDITEQMLEKEKEVIKNAYTEGCGDNILCESTDKKRAEEYYNETFNTNQENLQDSTNGYTYYPQEYKTVFNIKEK